MIEAMSGAVVDPFDGPEIALVVGQVVTALGLIVVAIIANRTRQHSLVTRGQLENDHTDAENPNLRVDLDEKDRTQNEKLDTLITDVHAMRQDVGLLKQGWQMNRTDIDDLMDTAQQERMQRALWGPPPQTRRERRARDAR